MCVCVCVCVSSKLGLPDSVFAQALTYSGAIRPL